MILCSIAFVHRTVESAPLRAEGCGPETTMSHPCLRCGACCAYFRVAFHWSEAESFLGGTVPSELTAKLDPHRVAMVGTNAVRPYCKALHGVVGETASCSIYVQRPSVCRELVPAWEQGAPSPKCDRARQAHGLLPLQPEDWSSPEDPGIAPMPRSA
ncbi:MAG: YkgJ family cysteine cluster protein [Rudaea sp.]